MYGFVMLWVVVWNVFGGGGKVVLVVECVLVCCVVGCRMWLWVIS